MVLWTTVHNLDITYLAVLLSLAMEKPKIHLPKSNETCEICDTVMTYLKMFLAENETQVHDSDVYIWQINCCAFVQ